MENNTNSLTVTCPKCSYKFPLTETLTQELERKIKLDYDNLLSIKLNEQEKEIEEKLKAQIENNFKEQVDTLNKELSEKDDKIRVLTKKESALLAKEREILEKEGNLELEFERKIKIETDRIKSSFKDREKEIEERVTQEISSANQEKIDVLKKQLDKQCTELQTAKKKESELIEKEENLNKREQSLKVELQQLLSKEKISLEKSLKEEARKELDLEKKDMQHRISELNEKLEIANNNEITLRKRERELEDAKKEFELKLQRELDDSKRTIYEKARKESDDEFLFKLRENEEKMKQMNKTIEELRKKSEQGSQQLQGEVQELELENFLVANFAIDGIQPVTKGKKGGDVIQVVKNNLGQVCGSILWESKRTKNWSDSWIGKLKEDQREAKADLAVIVSQVLPEGVVHLGQKDGIWIIDLESTYGLALALREQLIQINQLRNSAIGKNQKMETIYQYLCSNEFKHRIEAIVDSFINMKSDLEAEKRAFEKHWSKREKSLEAVIKNTSGMYGDLQGLIGSALPEVKQLELPGNEMIQ